MNLYLIRHCIFQFCCLQCSWCCWWATGRTFNL